MITSSPMPTTAFVAGATGYTGREVVRLLRARKLDVIAHVRPDSSQLQIWQARWEPMGVQVDSTAWEPEAMAETIKRVQPDLVFALLGTTQARARREAKRGVPKELNSYEVVDYGMTKMLMDGLSLAESRARFVYLSSEGASEGGNAYVAVRGRIERELAEGPLLWTVARPSFITGPDREESRPAETIGAVVADGALGVLALLGGRKTQERYRSTTATALASALVHHSVHPPSVNQILRGEDLRGFGPV